MEKISNSPDSSANNLIAPDRWGFDTHLKPYLLLLASRGPVAFETLGMYPKRMGLGTTWQQTLNDMRVTSWADGFEKWVFAGVKHEMAGIFLPTVPISGTYRLVSGETMNIMKNWARNKHGIVGFLGSIHSHPSPPDKKSHNIFPFMNRKKLIHEFSPADFYYFLVSDEYFMGLVAGDYNLFVFKARESQGLGVNPIGLPQKVFEKFWYEKFGYRCLESGQSGVMNIQPISSNASLERMNTAIAEKHKLLIYQGKKDEDLIKIFPK